MVTWSVMGLSFDGAVFGCPQLSKVRARRSITPEVMPAQKRSAMMCSSRFRDPLGSCANYFAAVTMISTVYCGAASFASTVARAGVLPDETQPSHTAFISPKVFMSVM